MPFNLSLRGNEGKKKKTVPDQAAESMRTLTRGITVNSIGSGYNVVARLLFNVLIARILGPHDSGVYYLALTVAYFASVVAVGGLDSTVIRYLALYRVDQDWAAFRGTLRFAMRSAGILGILGSLCLLFGASWIANTLFQKPELVTPLRIVALYVPLYAVEAVLLAATQSFKQMKYKAYIEHMLNPTLRIILATAIYLLGGRVYAVLGGYIVSLLVCAVLSVMAVRRCVPVHLRAFRAVAPQRELVKYWVPMFGVSLFAFMGLYSDTLILGHFGNTAQVGIYSVCIRLIIVQGFLLGIVGQIFSPMVSELHHRAQIGELSDYSKVIALWTIEAFAPIALVFLLAPQEILAIFGAGFRAGTPVLLILLAGQVINYLTGPVGLIVSMAGWSRMQLVNMSVSVLIQIVIALLLVPRLGATGAAIANTSALITLNLLQLAEVRQRLGFHPLSRLLTKPLLAVIAGIAAAAAIERQMPSAGLRQACLMCGGMLAAYVTTLYLLGLDRHSKIAWQQFKTYILPRLLKPALASTR